MSTNTSTILITGATTGIGRHAALHLAAAGHRVIATGRKARALAELSVEAKGSLETVVLDVTSGESIAAAVREVDRLTGGRGIDALVNNAGYGQIGPLSELTDADLRAQYETNVFGLMAVTRAFLPRMMARRSGRVLNISSVGGRFTFPFFGAYNSTKYAVEALSDALRIEMRPFGVKVVLVEPGPINTNFSNRAVEALEGYKDPTSPYAPLIARSEEIRAMTDKQSVGPEKVSRVIERAITRARPAARYVVPFSSKVMLWFFERLPTRVLDWALAAFMGLTPRMLTTTPQVEAPALPR